MRQIRPLLAIDGIDPRLGGPPRVVVGLACQLASQGLFPQIVSLCTTSEQVRASKAWPELAEAAVTLHLFPKARPHSIHWSPRHWWFLRERLSAFDIVHLHGLWSASLAYAAAFARRAGVPYVVAPHGMLDAWSLSRSRFKKRLASTLLGVGPMLRGAQALQFGTADEAREARILGLPAKEYIIGNGVALERFERTRSHGVEELLMEFPELRDRRPIALFLGRLHPKKGADLLCEAFASVVREFPRAGLLLAGLEQDRGYHEKLRRRMSIPDLAGRAFLTTSYVGERAKLAVNLADFVVVPSYQEGFSVVLLEALAYGLPVLVTDRCHMSDIEKIGAGLVVPASAAGLAIGLRTLIGKEPAVLEDMGEKGRAWARANFSWPTIGGKVEDMYREMCAHAGRAP